MIVEQAIISAFSTERQVYQGYVPQSVVDGDFYVIRKISDINIPHKNRSHGYNEAQYSFTWQASRAAHTQEAVDDIISTILGIPVGNDRIHMVNYTTREDLYLEDINKWQVHLDFIVRYGHTHDQPSPYLATYDTTLTESGSSDSSTLRIPLTPDSAAAYVKWGDGQEQWIPAGGGVIEHTYDTPGVYDVSIYGKMGIKYEEGTSKDKNKITHIKKWGGCKIGEWAFGGCYNIEIIDATDVPRMGESIEAAFHELKSVTLIEATNWDLSGVEDISYAFAYCNDLMTLNVSKWDVINVTNAFGTFLECDSLLTLDVRYWNIENFTIAYNFLTNGTIPTTTYDQILNNWSAQNVNPGLDFNFGNSKYSPTGLPGRDYLTNTHGWTINDGGPV